MPSHTPMISASFVLGTDGKPEYKEGKTKRHYRIKLSVTDAPSSTQSVTYHLHRSYRRPVREVFRKAQIGAFDEFITSYGDYQLTANLSGSTTPIVSSLHAALQTSQQQPEANADQNAIHAALNDIEKY